MILISVAKIEDVSWSHVTEMERRASDAKKLVPDVSEKSDDPSEGLMNIMRKMYAKTKIVGVFFLITLLHF